MERRCDREETTASSRRRSQEVISLLPPPHKHSYHYRSVENVVVGSFKGHIEQSTDTSIWRLLLSALPLTALWMAANYCFVRPYHISPKYPSLTQFPVTDRLTAHDKRGQRPNN
mgnify:CR=1 FL=1